MLTMPSIVFAAGFYCVYKSRSGIWHMLPKPNDPPAKAISGGKKDKKHRFWHGVLPSFSRSAMLPSCLCFGRSAMLPSCLCFGKLRKKATKRPSNDGRNNKLRGNRGVESNKTSRVLSVPLETNNSEHPAESSRSTRGRLKHLVPFPILMVWSVGAEVCSSGAGECTVARAVVLYWRRQICRHVYVMSHQVMESTGRQAVQRPFYRRWKERASAERVSYGVVPLGRALTRRRPKHCAKTRFVVSTTMAKGNN
jgi:hypothetical protein